LATIKNPEAVDIYLYRAMCLKDLEDYGKALEMLDFISGIADIIAEVHTIRAEVFRILGKASQAESEMQKAYEMKPALKAFFSEAGE